MAQVSSRHAIDSLEDGLQKMTATAKASVPKITAINQKNIYIPRGIRLDDTLIVQNSLSALEKSTGTINSKFERFR